MVTTFDEAKAVLGKAEDVFPNTNIGLTYNSKKGFGLAVRFEDRMPSNRDLDIDKIDDVFIDIRYIENGKAYSNIKSFEELVDND